MKNMESDISILPMLISSGPAEREKNVPVNWQHLLVDNGIKIKFGIECRVNDVEEKTICALVKGGTCGCVPWC